jgi:aldehyde dehydrogenase (NAD+)
MSEEIFGPVLPLIPYRDVDAVVRQINAGHKPLALYIWSRNSERTRQILQKTSSGGVAINHCVLHYAHGNLPFGGVNNSGIGNAHGHFGFKAFSHERALLKSGPIMMAKMFFPPYTDTKKKLIRLTVDSLRWPSLF